MTLQLSGNLEKNQYKSFLGRPIDTMPVLVEQGYDPASVALIVDRRETAPEEVIQAWQSQGFWTGDGASTDHTGSLVLTLDAYLLKTINSVNGLYWGTLTLSQDEWQALKSDDASITLSPEEVEEAYGRGLVKKYGQWIPVNNSVGKVINHLLRGRDFQTYAQMVSDASNGNPEVLIQYFDSKPNPPTCLRSVVIDRTHGISGIDGVCNLDLSISLLAGVAPEDN